MAFIYCRDCGWQQDDFWSESYNPLRSLLDWEDLLLHGNLEAQFTDDAEFVKQNGPLTNRQLLRLELQKAIGSIMSMEFRTEQEFKKDNPNWVCPGCLKSRSLEVD